MLRKSMILFPVALGLALPFAASAETMDKAETEMFLGATLTVQQAGEVALKAHAGTLAGVVFGDENGRAAYEAVVVGSDGQPWTIMIDAKSGEVFASALSSAMEDHQDSANAEDGEEKDGETNGG